VSASAVLASITAKGIRRAGWDNPGKSSRDERMGTADVHWTYPDGRVARPGPGRHVWYRG
jgi:hypothetical protein